MSLPETFKRSLRSFTWHALSSPLTYSAFTPAAFIVASVVSTRVDLPIPGSPPISTRLPGAKPPPSTRSNSEFAVLNRRVSSVATSFNKTTLWTGPPSPRPTRPAPSALSTITCSLSELHAPQNGHFPAHLGVVLPHSVQRYSISFFDLFTATMCTNIIKTACQKVTYAKIVFKKAVFVVKKTKAPLNAGLKNSFKMIKQKRSDLFLQRPQRSCPHNPVH